MWFKKRNFGISFLVQHKTYLEYLNKQGDHKQCHALNNKTTTTFLKFLIHQYNKTCKINIRYLNHIGPLWLVITHTTIHICTDIIPHMWKLANIIPISKPNKNNNLYFTIILLGFVSYYLTRWALWTGECLIHSLRIWHLWGSSIFGSRDLIKVIPICHQWNPSVI